MKKYIFIYSILFFFFLNGMLFGQTTRTWNGSVSSDPDNISNWDNNLPPSAGDSVTIPGGCSHYPSIAGSINLHAITLRTGAQATVTTGGSLTTNTVNIESNATATLEGTATISITGTTTNRGTITGGSGTLTFTGNVTNSGGTITGGSGTLTFAGNVKNDHEATITSTTGNQTYSGDVQNFRNSKITGGSGALTFTGSYDELLSYGNGTLTPSTSTTTFNSRASLVKLTIVQNATVTARNNLTITHNLEVNTNGKLLLEGIAAISVTGTTTNNGTITGGSGTLTFTGDYSGSGTLTASSGTTNFGSNVTFGTFTHNSGAVVFNGGKPQSLTTNEKSFNNVELRGNSTRVTVAGGDLTIGGTLETASNTTLTLNTHTLSVAGATTNNGTITGGGGALTFTGAVTNYGGRIAGGSGILTFTGTYDEFHSSYPGALTPSTSQTTFNREASLNNLTITQNATVTAHNNLSVKQDLEVNTNGKLLLEGTGLLTITRETTNNGTITGGSGTLTFTGDYSGSGTLTASSGTTNFGSDVTFGTFAHNNGAVVFKGTANASLTTSNQQFNDVFIDRTNISTRRLTCKDNLTVTNFYAFNGTIDLSTHTLSAQNVALFGSNYNENDRGWTNTTNTRHAYYSASRPKYFDSAKHKYENQNLTFTSSTTPSAQITGDSPKIIVLGNFYANGVDLSNINLNIPNNDNSKPETNTGTSATQKQWGSPYAVVLNAAVTDCTAQGGSVAASTGEKNNNVTDGGGNNTNFKFDALEIESAKTVSDNIIKITFNQLIENRDGEIKKALARTDLDAGAIYTHNGTIKFAKVFESKEHAFSGTPELSNKNIYTIYLKLGSETWNTDATGTDAGNTDSTNRAGIHQTTIPNLSFLKGALYAANGKNMCANYMEAARFTGTTDGAKPVLVAVYTGQEEHASGVGTSIPKYDAHNFIEFRYSEPVDIGNGTTITNNATNIQVTENLGKYISAGTGLTGFKLAGLGTFTNGKITAGSRTISGTQTHIVKNNDSLTHALYRYFPLTKGGSAQNNPCRIRFSVAGYVNGTVNLNHFWGGFIDALTTPTGTVTPIANTIKDKATSPNNLDTSKTATITTSSGVANSLYGLWDTSPPVFAKHTLNTDAWTDGSKTKEIIGGTNNSASPIVSHMEFHLHDNTPSYQSSTPNANRWITSQGWNGDSNTIPDTRGGIRESSLVGSQRGFSFRNKVQGKTTNIITFTANIVRKIFTKTYFKTDTNNIVAQDSLYFSIPLPDDLHTQDDNFPLRSHFAIMYKQGSEANRAGGFVTDLAGNRLKSVTENDAFSVDASPPQIALTLAPVGTKDLLIMFSKAIKTDNLDAITRSFSIQNGSSLQINTSQRAKIVFDTADSTALAFKLNQNISFNDLKNASIQVDDANRIIDKNVQGVTIPNNASHTMSDFAVNVIEPLNVYDKTYLENANHGFQNLNLYGNNLAAVRLFDGSGEPGNTLIKTDNVFMQVKVKNAGQTPIVPKLYISSNPTPESISKNFNKSSLLHSRLWLPEASLPIANNENTNKVEIAHNSVSASTLYNFTVNLTNPMLTETNQLQFLFELQEISGGNPPATITIDHDKDNNTPEISLYAIRLKNPNDLSSIDLWSFNLDTPKTQKGGVSIFNNVINTRNKEEVRLQISMPKAGALTIHILTLDGNIVKTLHNAVLSAGEHFFAWNGTNNAGDSVARGLYFVRVVGPNIDETRKIMTIKE